MSEAGNTEHRSLSIPDSRVGLYLWFAAEASFLAALMGASTVLKYSMKEGVVRNTSIMPLGWLAATLLAAHVVVGTTWQLRGQIDSRTTITFWALTTVLALAALATIFVR